MANAEQQHPVVNSFNVRGAELKNSSIWRMCAYSHVSSMTSEFVTGLCAISYNDSNVPM